MKCPVCNREFDDELELKTKPKIYLCMEHGLFQEVNGKLEPVKYPCPKCRSNYKAPKRIEGTWAICECEIHGEWRVSFVRSFKFRKLCSIVASKPNKSSSYYTPPERKVREILNDLGLKYEHNKMFRNGRSKYYVDFCIEDPKLVIEVSPSIWHERWNREESELRKKQFLRGLGYSLLELTERDKSWRAAIIGALHKLKEV